MKNLLNRLWIAALQPQATRWLVLGTGFWLGCLSWVRHLHLPDEGRYVGVAWDMARADSFLVPLMNGLPYFHKPPLFYWLTDLSVLVFGAHEWSVRIPSWLAAWSSAIALYFFIRKHRGLKQATLSLIILCTLPLFYGGAQYANLDMLVAGLISLTILAGAHAVLNSEQGQPYRWVSVAAAVFAGLAILAKGLIGLALPGGVLFFWLLLTKRWRKLGVLLWPPAIVAFVAVTLPWFWAMQAKFPEFFNYFFIHQQFERFVSKGFNNPQPVWFYLPVLFGMTLPWSLGLLVAFNRRFWQSSLQSFGLLMLIWLLLIFIFFSIPASKLIGYILPALPPLAVLSAEALLLALQGRWASHIPRAIATYFVISSVACVAGMFVFRFIQTDTAYVMGTQIVAQKKPTDVFVYVRSYPFDLAFYAAATEPAWVVENWDNLPKRDNWRNELADAARFNPELGKQTLINFKELVARLCASEPRVFWVRGDRWVIQHLPFLAEIPPFFEQPDGGRLWKLETDAAFKAKLCTKAE